MTRDEILRLIERPTWMVDAACRGLDPNLFHPHQGGDTLTPKAICRECDVQVECLTHAMNTGEKIGIWGGTSERERRRLRRKHGLTPVTVAPIDHGTNNGYEQHRRRGEPACPSCLEGHAAYVAEGKRDSSRVAS